MGANRAATSGGRGPAILALTLPVEQATRQRPLRLLLLGAHCDDIEIGVGGTLLEWTAAGVPLDVDWVVLTSTSERAREAGDAANAFLREAQDARVTIHGFRDGFLPYEGPAVKEAFEDLKDRIEPDIVFTHARDDRHQDHRAVSDLAWSTFRDHLVLEYEIPKYDGDLGQPNCFVGISEHTVQRKWALLRDCYPSQADRYWFTASTFQALARLRGVEARSPTGYAEAYVARKLTVALAPSPTAAASTAGNGAARAIRIGSGAHIHTPGRQERA